MHCLQNVQRFLLAIRLHGFALFPPIDRVLSRTLNQSKRFALWIRYGIRSHFRTVSDSTLADGGDYSVSLNPSPIWRPA